jgi:hypothetical protein
MTPFDPTVQLPLQLTWHWEHHLRPRLDGLTDDEYLWEPLPGCLTVTAERGKVERVPGGGPAGAEP